MPFDPLTLIMLAVLALLIFFMFRNSRKRQKDAQELQSKVVAGAKVMTNSGVFGTILSIDEEDNEVLLESTPGTVLAVHRQTIARVVTATESDVDDTSPTVDTVGAGDAKVLGEPEFGERIDDADSGSSDSTINGKKAED
ncbi:preprotein translocase subunit YajC [Luethyella okanaganae]|uniref:Preprotein translocase subunit YajC n=1 Tax=Luethyella okanaganae TaxID=69372 RepID=A0ABW1VBH4_9MICO